MMLCALCGSELEVVKNGVKVRYGQYSGYFLADLYECPVCGIKVLAGFGDGEVFDDSEVDFDFREVM